jgi:BCD family chlorophyll transporter-like MFS transporter
MRRAPKHHIGLALGAWGAVQATAAGAGVALGGVMRDLILALPGAEHFTPATPYLPVFGIEIAVLLLTLVVLFPRDRKRAGKAEKSAYIP